MQPIRDFLSQPFLDNAVWQWLAVPLLLIGALAALRVVRAVLVRWLRSFSGNDKTRIDNLAADIIDRTRIPLLFFIALYAGTLILTLPNRVTLILGTLALASALIQVGLWATEILVFAIQAYGIRDGDPQSNKAAVETLSFLGRLVLWSIIGLVVVDNIPGVKITTLIASLGITGIAVALAVQNILGDLFGSLSILLDQPFVVGDLITVGDMSGVVEHIGLKSTRVRSVFGEELVFSNSDLLSSRIRNFKEMEERRVVLKFGVNYDTDPDKLAAIPGILRQTIEAQENVRFDRSHLTGFGDSALMYESVYYMLDPDNNLYLDTQQTISLALIRIFAQEGIEFALPARTIHMAGSTAEAKGEKQGRQKIVKGAGT